MKHFRRVEISAFRKRVIVLSGEFPAADLEDTTSITIDERDTRQPIDPASDQGRRLLADAIRLLEEKLEASEKNE